MHPWKVHFETKHRVLVARVTGKVDAAEVRRIRSAVRDQELTDNAPAVLLDLRNAAVKLDILEILDLAESHNSVFPAQSSFALVYSPRTVSAPLVQFAEEVISRQGGSFRIFTGPSQAMHWLNSNLRSHVNNGGDGMSRGSEASLAPGGIYSE